MTVREAFVNAVTNKIVRRKVYDEARRILPNTGSRCALTVWLFCRESGLALKPPSGLKAITYTVDLYRALLKAGATRIDDPAQLKRGDICFSKDGNDTPGPDHVYVFHSSEPDFPATALIVDNYEVDPHSRNIVARRPKTPFGFALRLP